MAVDFFGMGFSGSRLPESDAVMREQAAAMRAEDERRARERSDARPMDARDTFAAAALTGMLAARTDIDAPSHARAAYELADAMLAERAKARP